MISFSISGSFWLVARRAWVCLIWSKVLWVSLQWGKAAVNTEHTGHYSKCFYVLSHAWKEKKFKKKKKWGRHGAQICGVCVCDFVLTKHLVTACPRRTKANIYRRFTWFLLCIHIFVEDSMFLESGDKQRFLYAYISPVQLFADQTVIYFSGPYKLRWVKMPEKHMQSGNDQCCVWGKPPFSSTLIIQVKNSGILWYDCVLKSGLNLY